MLYKGDLSVNDAACPAEAGGLSALSLSLLDNAGWVQSQQQINYHLGVASHLQENLNYNLRVVDKNQQIM